MTRPTIELYLGDCLEVLPTLPEGSVDSIIADIPYGRTGLAWDKVIPLDRMWDELLRVRRPHAPIVLFATQPFTSVLVCSNLAMFKYDICWKKNIPTGGTQAKRQPMRVKEDILVFYDGPSRYNPQLMQSVVTDRKITGGRNGRRVTPSNHTGPGAADGSQIYLKDKVTPRNVVEFKCIPRPVGSRHPTEKPLDLIAYLVLTYSNPGDTVLDFTVGTGTTLHACINAGRNGIGIEKDPEIYKVAEDRILKRWEEVYGAEIVASDEG